MHIKEPISSFMLAALKCIIYSTMASNIPYKLLGFVFHQPLLIPCCFLLPSVSPIVSLSLSSASKFYHLGIMDVDLPEDQSLKNVVKLLSKSKGAAASLHKIKHQISKRSSESTSRQRSHKNSTKKTSSEKNDLKITSKDQKKHRVVLEDKKLPDGVELFYISKSNKEKAKFRGYTQGRGILCCHCYKVVSPTMFEAHAGRSSSKKPYQHIFLSNGMSLHQYASSLKLNAQKRVESNDLLCMVCQKGGDLLFCAGCPRSFHKGCISDTIITTKKNFCKPCQLSMKCLVPTVKDGKASRTKPVVKDGTVSRTKPVVKDGTVSRTTPVMKDGTVSRPEPVVKDGLGSRTKPVVKDGTVSRTKPAVKDGTVSRMKPVVKDGTVSRPEPVVKDGLGSRTKPVLKDGTVSRTKPVVKDGTVSRPEPVEQTAKPSIQITVSRTEPVVKDGTVSRTQPVVKDITVSRTEPAVKDGMASRKEPIEQTAKPNVQIDSSCDQIACVLCRSSDFSADGFNDRTSIVCDQCEKEYHIGCLKKDMNIVLQEVPTGDWFCTADCKSLHSLIKFVIDSGPLMAKPYYMEIVKEKLKGSDANSIKYHDVRWFVFSGKDACEEHRVLLPQAIDILHDRFSPIIDSVTGEDFIPSMAYGRQMGSSNFSGVYNALLTINLKVVTAGMLRVFGREFVELSIVATSQANEGKGYFQVFLVCLENLLSLLRIKKLVIPAAADAKGMWIKKFGFMRVPSRTLARYRQTQTSMVAFQGTTLLQRDVPQGLCWGDVKPLELGV